MSTCMKDGETALMVAAQDGYTEMVQVLIAAGASVHFHDEEVVFELSIFVVLIITMQLAYTYREGQLLI